MNMSHFLNRTSRTYTLGQALRLDLLSRTETCRKWPSAYRQITTSSESLAEKQDPHESARARLKPLIDDFEAPVDYAVAYGSGVIHQANRSADNEPAPLTDLIISTPDAKVFHRINLKQNPSHYPLLARLVGGNGIAWLQENWGARVWYVTMVKIRNLEVKYGIISTQTLKNDLQTWETLYISGRLQKPHLPLLPQTPTTLSTALDQNKSSALNLALVLLGEKFTEYQLWEKIAGISYAGDPRMSIPGAENPEKVRNIVRGEGALEGFRAMYGDLLSQSTVKWEEGKPERVMDWEWRGQGDEYLTQSPDPAHLANLLLQLPLRLLHPVARHYRPTIVGSLVDSSVKEDRARELETQLKRKEVPMDKEFWVKVAGQERIREVVLNELRGIIGRPALTQSMKGLFTAGFTKSFWYSLAKFKKWLKGRKSSA